MDRGCSEQPRIAALAPVGRRGPDREAVDDQIGVRLLPACRDVVAGDVAVPQGDIAHAHVLIVAH